jgi:ABC-type amino acid transport substrate-binding protein
MCARLAAGLIAALAVASPSGAGDLPDILKRGTIKVIAAADEDPLMFSFKAGSTPGFERELIEGFAALHRIKVEAVAAKTYDDRLPMVNKGDGDVVIGVIETEARKKLVDFTAEVLPARHVVVSRAPKVVKTVEEFKAEKVGLLKGTTWAQAALDAGLPAASAEIFADRDAMLEALRAGRITATVMSVSDAALAIKKDPSLKAGVGVGAAARAAWAIRKEDDQLEKALNEYIENSRRAGSWGRLVVKYFGEQALAVLGREK